MSRPTKRLFYMTLLACTLGLVVSGFANAAPADLDRSFGTGGKVAVEGPAGAAFHTQAPPKMALGPEGDIFVLFANAPACPEFSGCPIEWSVARYSADGVRDQGFGVGPGSVLMVHGNEYEPADLAVGPEGKPVVAALDKGRVVVARFDLSGHVETMLGAEDPNPLTGGAYTPPVLAVQRDAKVLVAAGEAEKLRVIRYLPNGARDPEFGSGGETSLELGTRSRPSGLLVGANGSISVAAPQCCGGSAPFPEGIAFARFLANGQPDTGLAGSGRFSLPSPGAQSNVEAAALAPDGGAYIAFEVNTGPTATVGNVIKLLPDGTVDPAFGKSGISRFPISVKNLAVDGKGRLVAGGWSGSAAVSRMRPGGGLDRTFAGGTEVGLAATGPTSGLALQKGGKIVALTEPCCGTTKAFTLFRLVGGSDHTRCLGHKATIVGTSGRDELTGTPRRDVIAALGGADKVRGLGGADLICGGPGKDKLSGGAGRDRIRQ
jgi:uncharacterized delta-60 repeat protein